MRTRSAHHHLEAVGRRHRLTRSWSVNESPLVTDGSSNSAYLRRYEAGTRDWREPVLLVRGVRRKLVRDLDRDGARNSRRHAQTRALLNRAERQLDLGGNGE